MERQRLVEVKENCVTAKSQVREVLCTDNTWEPTHRRFWIAKTQQWGAWMDY